MRYSFVSAAVLAFASNAFSQATDGYNPFTYPPTGEVLTAGSTVEVKWQVGLFPTGSSSLTLLQGKDPGHLDLGQVVVASVKNSEGKYSWTIPKDIPAFATYGLQFDLLDDKSTPDVDESLNANKKKILQYSFPFKITTSGSSYGGSGTTTIQIGTGPAYTPPASSSTHASHNSSSTASSTTTSKPSSNYTVPTTTRSSASSSTSTPPRQSTGAGVSNVVGSGIALVGGLVLAMAL